MPLGQSHSPSRSPRERLGRGGGGEPTRPIASVSSPLAQATLMTDASGALVAVVLLMFSHQIADGRVALRAAHDLFTLIGGRLPSARPLPVARETLLERMPSAVEPEGSLTAVASSPRGAATLRPFDASPPNVEVAQLDHVTTKRLRANARAHAATVQGPSVPRLPRLCPSALAPRAFASTRRSTFARRCLWR